MGEQFIITAHKIRRALTRKTKQKLILATDSSSIKDFILSMDSNACL